jgi:hypothetical protein
MDQIVAAGEDGGADQAEGFDADAGLDGGFKQRRTQASEQGRFRRRQADPRKRWVPRPAPLQGLNEAEDLPLASAHRLARVQVEDPHQLMFLALEYFRNV